MSTLNRPAPDGDTLRRTFHKTQSSYESWCGCAQNGALLIDAMLNVRARNYQPTDVKHLDHSGNPLLGPVCTFVEVQGAVQRSQMQQYERLLSSLMQTL